ncbi:MAG: beta-propeller fold lactonase family protein [Candidatus Goldbacteria bacterium]|nr:beta-propeller fold lactonase family protein [Candidatus Goldiibacteriota bacterium]
MNFKEFFLILIIIISIFIFSGCKTKEKIMPQIEKNLKLTFIPTDIAVTDGGKILIGSERENKIYIVDMVSGKTKKVINSGINPVEILIKNNFVYSANKTSSNVTIYNLLNGETINLPSGGQHPSALEFNAIKKVLYVANIGSSNISIIDIDKKEIKDKISTEKWPADILLTKNNKFLYVACKYTNVIQLLDAEKGRCLFTKIDAGVSPAQLIELDKFNIAIINEWEYSFNQQSTINVFDTRDYKLKYNILVDGGIFRGVLSKSKKYLYITVPLKDKIIFVDIKKKKKIFEITKKESGPRFINISPDGNYIFISCQTSKEVTVIRVNDLL